MKLISTWGEKKPFFLGKNFLVLFLPLFRFVLNISSANVWISSLWLQTYVILDNGRVVAGRQINAKYILFNNNRFMERKVVGSDKKYMV